MIKPAHLAILAFVILGGLMWFAASGSMRQYIDDYQNTVSQKLPKGSEFSIQDVQFSRQDNAGAITGITLKTPVFNGEYATLNIDTMQWQYEGRSLKKKVVNTEWVMIENAQFELPNQAPKQALNVLNGFIEALVDTAEQNQKGLAGRKEFELSINKVTINNLYITLKDGETPIEEVIDSKLIHSSDTLTGPNQMSVAGAKVMSTIILAAEQSLTTQGK
ncbi:hypothetical protein ACFSJY_00620 [Thalassotalea euphylliae]|uniref:hypothetical protein n=1 Tax=Thalassotalea euphylliae TaxID=1655234 RepID=UPI00363C4A0D